MSLKDDNDRKIFVGGLSWATDENKLKEYFGQYGGVGHVQVKKDPTTGKPRGFAFVTFTEPSAVSNVINAGEHFLDGKKIDPKPARSKPGKIFVGGIGHDTTGDEVKEYFAQFGSITEFVMPFDKLKGHHKGFCFITYESDQALQPCLTNPRPVIKGKAVEVKKAVPQGQEGGPEGGMGGRGGRGGGRGMGRGRGRGGFQDGYGQGFGGGSYDQGGYGAGGYDQNGFGASGYDDSQAYQQGGYGASAGYGAPPAAAAPAAVGYPQQAWGGQGAATQGYGQGYAGAAQTVPQASAGGGYGVAATGGYGAPVAAQGGNPNGGYGGAGGYQPPGPAGGYGQGLGGRGRGRGGAGGRGNPRPRPY